ncbi:hypothetical protein [Methanogenium cariaci]|jgi:hypothetical protein
MENKSPAVSLSDTTVAEEVCGITLKKREHHFSFDHELYREWIEKSDVWLDDPNDTKEDHSGPDDYSIAAGLQHGTANDEASEKACSDGCSSKVVQYRDICTDTKGTLQQVGGTFTPPDQYGDTDPSFSVPGIAANKDRVPEPTTRLSSNDKKPDICRHSKIHETDKTYAKLQSNRMPGHTLPLPNILDHRTFRRSSVSLGRCTLCDNGPAVYHSDTQRASVCESCYVRLVREANQEKGVR